MSLLNNANGWMTREGEPVTGITPPSVVMRAGQMTPGRHSLVQRAYTQFVQARKLSPASGGYFTANRRLPDGTVVRMISINNVDHVHIWAADPVREEVLGVTFWCIPWDDEWIDEAFAEVFTIPQWLNIGSGEGEVLAVDFLKDLIRNEKYEPPMNTGVNYPGNQTWFAPPPHPSAGLVISWWGHMRRYRSGGMSNAIDGAAGWRGVDTGGIAGALAGQAFLVPGTGAFVGAKPTRAPLDDRVWFWLNGVRFSAGSVVDSACLGYRDGARVVRTAAPMNLGHVVIREFGGDTFDTSVVLADLDLRPAAMGLARPQIINGSPHPSNWTATARQLHPFYWNADGTEAIGIVQYFGFYESFGVQWSRTTNAVVKITVSGSGCTAAVVDTTNFEESKINGNGSQDFSLEYSRPVAADFRGNDQVIIRTHIEGTLTGTTTGTVTAESGSTTGSMHTWASVNEDLISGTSETKTGSGSWSSVDGVGGSEHQEWSSSGRVSWWSVLAGDLRGIFLLHGNPLRMATPQGWGDLGVGSITVDFSHDAGDGMSSVYNRDNLWNAQQGEMLLCDADGAASSLGNIVAPTDARVVGTYTSVDGSITASGPYGDGPTSDGSGVSDGMHIAGTLPGSPVSTVNTTSRIDFNDEPEYWSDVVLTGSAITPDEKTQYLGAVLMAMSDPADPISPMAFTIDKWFHDGNEFTPDYPNQPDPDAPGDTVPFPHRGGHAVLLDPIFTGPIP